MTDHKTSIPPSSDDRAERLAAQLRENLKRRKMQARSRRSGAEDDRADGLSASRNDDDA